MTAMSIAEVEEILADRNLIAVGVRGDEARRARHGAKTTFVRVLEIHTDAVPAVLPHGASTGEIRVMGKPPSVAAAIATVKAARTLAGDTPLSAFSLADLLELAGGMTASLTDL